MHPEYFETQFSIDVIPFSWPSEFAIISGFATTGQQWPDAQNHLADSQLEKRLRDRRVWLHRVVGYSPTTQHSEPSWAAAVSLETAREVARDFFQDAIYFVINDKLHVTKCEATAPLIHIGSFRQRLHEKNCKQAKSHDVNSRAK